MTSKRIVTFPCIYICIHIYIYYKPNWFIFSIFFLCTLVPFLWCFQQGIKIIYLDYNTYIHGNITMRLPVYLSYSNMFFFKNREQEGKRGYLAPVGCGGNIRKGCKRVNMVEICTHVRKWKIPIQTIRVLREGG
jgi:hypothetical protein